MLFFVPIVEIYRVSYNNNSLGEFVGVVALIYEF